MKFRIAATKHIPLLIPLRMQMLEEVVDSIPSFLQDAIRHYLEVHMADNSCLCVLGEKEGVPVSLPCSVSVKPCRMKPICPVSLHVCFPCIPCLQRKRLCGRITELLTSGSRKTKHSGYFFFCRRKSHSVISENRFHSIHRRNTYPSVLTACVTEGEIAEHFRTMVETMFHGEVTAKGALIAKSL